VRPRASRAHRSESVCPRATPKVASARAACTEPRRAAGLPDKAGFGDIDELAGRLVEAKRPARPGVRLLMCCSLRRGVGLRVGFRVERGVAYAPWLAREPLLASFGDKHSNNGRREPVSAGPGDYLFRYLRSALLTSFPLGHPRRDVGPRSEAELGKNVRRIAVDLAKRCSSFSRVPLPNTVLGERVGIGCRLSSRFERHQPEALRRR
jgi:hypothetical protein